MDNYLARSKQAWKVAGSFPPNKEEVYPAHGKVQEFDSIQNQKVYEYGCGGGSDVLSYLRRGNHVTASDIVLGNLEVTTQRITANKFPETAYNLILLQDSAPIPLPDNEFDVISSHGVLHHILNPIPIVKEFYRICKPSGLVYIMLYTNVMEEHFMDTGNLPAFVRDHGLSHDEAFGWCTDGPGTPYSRSYTVEQGAALLEDHGGFTLIDYNYWLNDFFVTYKACKL